MVAETRKCKDVFCNKNENKWPELTKVAFYAYGASAADDQILETWSNPYQPRNPHAQGAIEDQSVWDYFRQFGIDVRRTIATADTLADGIVSELRRRRVDPAADDVALISEWDTFYGQTIPQAVERKFAPDGGLHPWIHKFKYLRGLDGLLPSSAGKEDTKQDKSASSAEKQGGVPDFFKIESDTQTLERPIGESQYDYLRRISERLHNIDHDLRRRTADKRIKAIGILGGDVFDKLLILRALRPEFPEALFFTTDFDEAFTVKSELPYTRNLIISSSFGPNLSDWLQDEIPFFRDTYETSAFLTTQLAIGNLAKNLDISNQLLAPRLFEVKRNGEILSFAWDGPVPPEYGPVPPVSGPQNHDEEREDNSLIAATDPLTEGRSESPCWKGDGLSNCGYIQPAFLATHLAIGNLGKNLETPTPRIFEVNRSGEILPSEWPCWKDDDLSMSNCGYIQPVDSEELKKLTNNRNYPKAVERLFPTFEANSGAKLAASLAVGAIFSLVLLYLGKERKGRRVEVWLVVFSLVVASLTCALWEPIARFLTDDDNGEPIAMLEGVSVWPTVLLRVLGIILTGYFIW